jgi:pimeloyl-ACP methyl ester carboxylesterase
MARPKRARSGAVRLADGRKLAYASYGDPLGAPVLYFHGWPGAAVEVAFAGHQARRQGVRLVALDRPGMGGSDLQPGRHLLDWPADVAELADRLGLERFAVLGCSGGGPFAVAAAYALPDRVHTLGLLCPMGPLELPQVVAGLGPLYRHVFRLGRLETLVQGLLGAAPRVLAGGLDSPLVRAGVAAVRAIKNPTDRAALEHRGLLASKLRAAQRAFRQGSRGVARDGYILASPWGFDPAEVRQPAHLWHGLRDAKVPPLMSRALAACFPRAQLHLVPEGGHTSVQLDQLPEVLEALAPQHGGRSLQPSPSLP